MRRVAGIGIPVVVLVLLALVPKLSVEIPLILGGPLDSPGTLQVLALCLLFAGIALTYDVLFGFTGLLSFGHALYVALGVYMTAIALTRWEWGLWPTLGFLVVIGLAVPLVLGAVSLRVSGIAFAMVTLAFAQAGNVLVQKNPYGWTGGEEGTGLELRRDPRRVRRRPQHEEPLLARARLRGARVRRRPARRQLFGRSRLARDPGERAARRGDRPLARTRSS